MFKFLKDKLKGAISRISKKAVEEPKEETKIEEARPIKETPVLKKEEPVKQEIQKEEPKEEVFVDEGEGDWKDLEEIAEKKSLPQEPFRDEQPAGEILDDLKDLEEGKIVIDWGSPEEEEQKPEPAKEEKQVIPEKATEKEATLPALKEEKAVDQKIAEKKPEDKLTEEPKKKGFFGLFAEKLTTTRISREKFDSLFSELELIMMENNVAVEVIDKVKADMGRNIVEQPIKRTKVEETIKDSLRGSVEDLFKVEKIDLIKRINGKAEKPFVIAFFGINGSGKTTSIAKIASMLKQSKLSVVLAAADTFRAASIEQLQQHADKIGVKMIKHDYGSDPAAVAFDAIKHAKSRNADVVLIDTAGRLHSQQNLMQEMEKIIRVSKPDLKVFVGESITGNDCVEQAKSFNDAVGIDGMILTKADVDEKGGAAISVSYITRKPIMYLGMGQEYKDLKEFEPRMVIEGLGLG